MGTSERVLMKMPNRALQRLKNMVKARRPFAGAGAGVSDERLLEGEVCAVYQNLLGRQPDAHELIHWKAFIGMGNKTSDVANSLLASHEYQRKSGDPKVLVELGNFKMYALGSDLDVGRSIINTHAYEPHITRVLTETLKAGDVFLDLGANIGYFSLMAAGIVREQGKVISFEPNALNLQLLYSSIVENQFKNIKVYPFAASDSSQILKLTSFGSNGYLESAPSGETNFQLVQSVVVDELLQCETRIDVVKMDIEGYETLALKGMDKTVRKHRPVILTEYSPWHIEHRCRVKPQDYLRQITSYGYALSIVEETGALTPAPDADSVAASWERFRDDKHHLDLMARPV